MVLPLALLVLLGAPPARPDRAPAVEPRRAEHDPRGEAAVRSGAPWGAEHDPRGEAAVRSGAPWEVEHAEGELPPRQLDHCALHAGTEVRSSRSVRPPPTSAGQAPARVVHSTRTCSFDSECSAHRGQPPGPTDGTVEVSCRGDRCTCTVTTYVPAEIHVYRFVQRDPCSEVKRLLREVCGG